MRSLFSRSFPSFPRLSFAVPVLAVLCAALFVWAGESEARPEYASIQAGFGPAKVSYLPVTVGGKTLQIKVPEDFVLAEGVEETEWYKDTTRLLVESELLPLLLFVLPDDLHKLKESADHEPKIHFTVSAPLLYIDKNYDAKGFAAIRNGFRKSRNSVDDVTLEPDEAPRIANYIYEDSSLIGFIFTPDRSDPALVTWWSIAECYVDFEGKVIAFHVELDSDSGETAFVLLKNLVLRYFVR